MTERKLAETALKQSETRLRRILDSTVGFAGIMDIHGTLLEANAPALDVGGHERQEVVGRKIWESWWWSHDAEARTRVREAVKRTRAGEIVRYDEEVRAFGDGRMSIAAAHPRLSGMLSPVLI
ncbi:PAS domain S-box protein [Tranquillimonas alkanivorans]|uniref:PAS domain S-box protein n=1 Tax=Tranquillimonas alkanivorans TaxID=441119 RepID=UPI002481CA34|nr:PAS domain S-box protein [Tranquillimonas alkanivorans]